MLRSGEDMLEKFVSNVLEKTKPLELVIASWIVTECKQD
jgi:hypothetical protein